MKKLIVGLSLAVAFLAGCLATTVATSVIAPPARAGTNPQKWEYTCWMPEFNFNGTVSKNGVRDLNAAGRKGWELVVTGGGGNASFCFKRPLP